MGAAKSKNELIVDGVGERIRKFRENREWTKMELSKKAGCHYDSIVRLERGDRSPNLRTLAKIADSLEVGILDLLVLT